MRTLYFTQAALATALVACGGGDPTVDDFGYEGTGIGVTVAPLDLPGVNDACYSFEILSGAGERVVARGSAQGGDTAGQPGDGGPTWDAGTPDSLQQPICSTRFGNSQGAISYVAPCDASPGEVDGTPIAQHTVRLWVNAVCATGSLLTEDCEAIPGFINPCPGEAGCAVTATCVENADVPVQFNFTIMASAQQGFFDVAVNFDNVFCSAKLDTCYPGEGDEEDTLITLLHDGFGDRQHTAVAAVACSAGTGDTQTTLFFTELTVNCGGTVHTLDLGQVSQEGRLASPGPTLGDLTAAVYFGTEALEGMNKVYTNVAFLIPPGESCTVDWTIVPSDSDEEPPQPGDPDAGNLGQVAGVVFDPTHAIVEEGVCHNYSLNGSGPGAGDAVTTGYIEDTIPYTGGISITMVDFFPLQRAFVSVWKTDNDGVSDPNQIQLPLIEGGTYDFVVDWGDGSQDIITAWNQAERTHTYTTAGEYTVTITGQIEGWRFYAGRGEPGDVKKLSEVKAWGPLMFIALDGDSGDGYIGRFYGSENLHFSALDAPTIASGVSMRGDFRETSGLSGQFNHWDTSGVTDMRGLFDSAVGFNEDIGDWDVSNVTDMNAMFRDAAHFNQPIGNWDVSGVEDMGGMFA